MKLEIILFVILCVLEIVHLEQTVDEARAERQKVLKKFLKKEDGAIKLVGGRTSNEGNLIT